MRMEISRMVMRGSITAKNGRVFIKQMKYIALQHHNNDDDDDGGALLHRPTSLRITVRIPVAIHDNGPPCVRASEVVWNDHDHHHCVNDVWFEVYGDNKYREWHGMSAMSAFKEMVTRTSAARSLKISLIDTYQVESIPFGAFFLSGLNDLQHFSLRTKGECLSESVWMALAHSIRRWHQLQSFTLDTPRSDCPASCIRAMMDALFESGAAQSTLTTVRINFAQSDEWAGWTQELAPLSRMLFLEELSLNVRDTRRSEGPKLLAVVRDTIRIPSLHTLHLDVSCNYVTAKLIKELHLSLCAFPSRLRHLTLKLEYLRGDSRDDSVNTLTRRALIALVNDCLAGTIASSLTLHIADEPSPRKITTLKYNEMLYPNWTFNALAVKLHGFEELPSRAVIVVSGGHPLMALACCCDRWLSRMPVRSVDLHLQNIMHEEDDPQQVIMDRLIGLVPYACIRTLDLTHNHWNAVDIPIIIQQASSIGIPVRISHDSKTKKRPRGEDDDDECSIPMLSSTRRYRPVPEKYRRLY